MNIKSIGLLLLVLCMLWSEKAQPENASLNNFLLSLSQDELEGRSPSLENYSKIMGFKGNAQSVYADHLKKSWEDETIRTYLAARLGPVVRFSEKNEADLKTFERFVGLMPLALSAVADVGAYRLVPSQKLTYISALHRSFLVEANKGVDACIEAHYQVFGDDNYKAARHKINLMKNMSAKDLHSYLQVQRFSARVELRAKTEANKLTSDGVDSALGYIDPILDRFVKKHALADRINDYWFNKSDDKEAECETLKMEWKVLNELEGNALNLASQYYLEVFNGEH